MTFMTLNEFLAYKKRAKESMEFRFLTRKSMTQKLSRPRRSHCRRYKTVLKRVTTWFLDNAEERATL